MNKLQKIAAVHLYNDYSGSPRILAQWLKHAVGQGAAVELHTSGTGGILDEVQGIKRKPFSYAPHAWLLLRLLRFLFIQMILFFRMASLKKDVVVYVNTILPVGAILGAKLAGVPVVCHVHEVAVRPKMLDRLLKWVVSRFCDELIFVSDFVAKASGILSERSRVVPNALAPGFVKGIRLQSVKAGGRFRVLMLASARAYKGLDQFRMLAEALPNMHFELVLNGTQEEAEEYFSGKSMPTNLKVWPLQKDVHPFYAQADVVVNLSLPDGWVETFGMTALEGMAYGLPVIVPPVGGIAELVQHGKSGFHCDPYQIKDLASLIKQLAAQPDLYRKMSAAALQRAEQYEFDRFFDSIDNCIAQMGLAQCPKSGQAPRRGTLSSS